MQDVADQLEAICMKSVREADIRMRTYVCIISVITWSLLEEILEKNALYHIRINVIL